MTHITAYLDAGSAGVIVQMIGGGVAALLVALKIYGRKLLVFLHLKKKDVPQAVAPLDKR